MRKRQLVVALACAVAATGCSRDAPRTARPSTSTSRLDGPVAPGGARVPLPGSGRPASSIATSAPATGSPDRAARQAFDTWLRARIEADPDTVLASSTGPAAALGSVLLVGDQIVRGRGGSTATEITHDELHAETVTASQVSFGGLLETRETVHGTRGTATLRHTYAGPITVVRRGSIWKVSDLTYDDAPLAYYSEGRAQTNQGVSLSVAFVLSYADRTTALVGLRSNSPAVIVDVEKVVLSGESTPASAGSAATSSQFPTALFDFPRLSDGPAHLDVTLRKRPATTVQFSLDLHGRRG